MKKTLFVFCLSFNLLTAPLIHANQNTVVHYNDFDINQQLNQTELDQLSTQYLRGYFSNSQPDTVIDDLLKADITPLQKEYILFNLLTEISQQPPQAFHQKFVDRMKTYQAQASRTAEEGHIPIAVFNLNSKAHGIENIWTAYRSEQRFHQLFNDDIQQAISNIQLILAQESTQRRPQWLGVKNSIQALSNDALNKLSNHLLNAVKANTGIDALISHVGLLTGHFELIQKALSSNQPQVRELTLRHLLSDLPKSQAQALLLQNAQSGPDRKFSTSLLSQFSNESEVETFLINQLTDKTTAANAAFALSQSDSLTLPVILKNKYLISNNKTEKNHILLTLKLNKSSPAQLALEDLKALIEKGSSSAKWIKSFDTRIQSSNHD